MVQFLAPFLDRAFVGEVAQHALEFGAQRVLQAEGAGDFAGADFARLLADEGEDVGLGGEGGVFLGSVFKIKVLRRAHDPGNRLAIFGERHAPHNGARLNEM